MNVESYSRSELRFFRRPESPEDEQLTILKNFARESRDWINSQYQGASCFTYSVTLYRLMEIINRPAAVVLQLDENNISHHGWLESLGHLIDLTPGSHLSKLVMKNRQDLINKIRQESVLVVPFDGVEYSTIVAGERLLYVTRGDRAWEEHYLDHNESQVSLHTMPEPLRVRLAQIDVTFR